MRINALVFGWGALIAAGISLIYGAPVAQRGKGAVDPSASDAGLVLQLDFGKAPSGNIAHDQSGHGNDGHVEGATWVPNGRQGGALRFDGSAGQQRVRVANADSLNPKRFSIAVWVKCSSANNKWNRIVDKNYREGFCLNIGGPSHWAGQVGLEVPGGHNTFSGQQVTDDQWHHIAATYDGAEQDIYLDGRLCSDVVRWTGAFPTSTCDLIIGNRLSSTTGTDAFDGLISEIRIYSRALSAEELAALAGTKFTAVKPEPGGTVPASAAMENILKLTAIREHVYYASLHIGIEDMLLGDMRYQITSRGDSDVDGKLDGVSRIFKQVRALSEDDFLKYRYGLAKQMYGLVRLVPHGSPAPGLEHLPSRIEVSEVNSRYAAAPAGKTGAFVTGQEADVLLGGFGFNNAGGATHFNHPSGLATDGKNLLVADRWNNRVLLWKTAPAKNLPPDLVLGQPDFIQNNSGTNRNQMNWPGNVSVAPDGNHIAVADTSNDRILLWNSCPTTPGAPADVVLDLMQLYGKCPPDPRPGAARVPFGWPWGVWTDGKKLAAVATRGNAVLIWNAFPSHDNQPPNMVLRPQATGSPRNITSDGIWLAVSDQQPAERTCPATMIWRTFPTSPLQEPDFMWNGWLKGALTPDQFILSSPGSIFICDPPRRRDNETVARIVLHPKGYRNGEGPDAVLVADRLYVCNYGGNSVLGWSTCPTDYQRFIGWNADPVPAPDFALGSDLPTEDAGTENYFIANPVLATDGHSLFAASEADRTLYVWRNLPDASAAKPDLVYHLPQPMGRDMTIHNSTLLLAGPDMVYGWTKPPHHGELPDFWLGPYFGKLKLESIAGVALDDRYFYLSDVKTGRIYVWEGLPTPDIEPKFSLAMQSPGQLSSDGQYLAAAPAAGNGPIQIWRISQLGPQAKPQPLGAAGMFYLPRKCLVSDGHLIVADTFFNRVHVWNQIENALAGRPADALLGNEDRWHAGIGGNRLFWPNSIAFGGGYLWVGECKGSSRILRFSPGRSSASQAPTPIPTAR